MDKLVNRVTVIQRTGDNPQAITVYVKPRRKRRGRRESMWAKPIDRALRRMAKAQIAFGQALLQRHEDSRRRRRDGWLMEEPANIAEAAKAAYNEARKSVPFRLLPKR